MTERKPTDEEVIEFLRKQNWISGIYLNEDECFKITNDMVADLINRQKAEVERLSKVRCHFPNDNYCKVVEVNEENEILKEENKRLIFDLEIIKAEAIKEFAERLKEELRLSTGNNGGFVPSMIDNLVKEMTEGENEC